ncbi:MAG: hypothetical protein DRJ63_08595 [Thermoprotei archaeon]|nr:MAG: hypothetical protein DRJ63_08595 [Thermoprotei archaeon]
MSALLLARLAKIKQVREAEEKKLEEETGDLSSRSSALNSTPLWTLLHIYNKAKHECYINNMEGAKALIAYLSPIKLFYSDEYLDSITIPPMFKTYSLQQLAKYVAGYGDNGDYSDEAMLRWKRAEKELALITAKYFTELEK